MAILIVVTGPPASGKSTLSSAIGAAFGLPVLAKDALKESLADDLAVSGHAWSSKTGLASINLLFQITGTLLESGVSLILDGNFHPELARPDFERLAAHGSIIQVVCRANPDVLLERYRQRWESGIRHPIHRDDIQATQPEFLAQLTRDSTVGLPTPVITVDTTAFETLDIDAILAQIEAAISPSGEQLRHHNRATTEPSQLPHTGRLS